MKDRNLVKKARRVMIGIGLLLVTFVCFHFTIEYDIMKSQAGPEDRVVLFLTESARKASKLNSGEARPGAGFTALGNTVGRILERPFDFNGLVIFHSIKFIIGACVLIAIVTVMYKVHKEAHRQDRIGEEKGSTKWYDDMAAFDKEFVDDYTKEDKENGLPDNNILLAKGLKMSMNTRKTQRNLNNLVIGGSGAGKTFRFIKPNLAQMNCSYVITDPSGEILQSMGVALMENGYKIKLFSISDMRHSNSYNPMDYIYDDNGEVDQTKVGILVSTFIKNAGDSKKKGGGDPFWEKSSVAFMTFAVLFLAEFMPVEKRNMYQVLKLAQSGKTDEDSSSSQTMLDKIVAGATRKNPKAKCLSSYWTFKLAPAKTANSILISMAVDLNPFSMDNVRNLTTTSYLCERNKQGQITNYIKDAKNNPIRDNTNLDLESIGDSKTALFVNIPQANGAFNFLISMMYSQLFETLYSRAERVSPNRYHIYDTNGIVISSQYKSEKEAKEVLELYQNAEVVEYKDKKEGVTRYFIYNKKAGKEHTMPEMLIKKKKGYMEEVYSKEVGEMLLKRYRPIKKLFSLPKSEGGEKKKPTLPVKLPVQKNKPSAPPKKRTEPYVARGALRLPMHVRFLLDEFSNIGEIPDFDKMLSTMRKYEISCTIILQSLSQIKAQYDKIWEVMVGNCDSIIFLGSSENETTKYISERLGKQTIRTIDSSSSKSNSGGSVSESIKKEARDLLDPSEVGRLDNTESIIIIRGLYPFKMKKLDFTKHPNFPLTGDYDKSRIVDEKYLDAHFKCLNKEEALEDDVRAEDEKQREAMSATQQTKKQSRVKVIQNSDDLKKEMNVEGPEGKKRLKKMEAVGASEKMPEAGLVPVKAAEAGKPDDAESSKIKDAKEPVKAAEKEAVKETVKQDKPEEISIPDRTDLMKKKSESSDGGDKKLPSPAKVSKDPSGPESEENEWLFE